MECSLALASHPHRWESHSIHSKWRLSEHGAYDATGPCTQLLSWSLLHTQKVDRLKGYLSTGTNFPKSPPRDTYKTSRPRSARKAPSSIQLMWFLSSCLYERREDEYNYSAQEWERLISKGINAIGALQNWNSQEWTGIGWVGGVIYDNDAHRCCIISTGDELTALITVIQVSPLLSLGLASMHCLPMPSGCDWSTALVAFRVEKAAWLTDRIIHSFQYCGGFGNGFMDSKGRICV